MSSVLDVYGDRMEEIICDRGFSEMGVVLRRGKTQDTYTISDHKNIFLEKDTEIDNGDIVTRAEYVVPDRYIIVAKQISADCASLQGKRINTSIDIYRLEDVFDDKHRRIGSREVLQQGEVPVYCEDQSTFKRYYDAGWLPSVIKRFFVQTDTIVNDLDRIRCEGKNYQVDDVEKHKYRNLWVVQVSEDARK